MMRPALRGIITFAASLASAHTPVRLVSITRWKSAASNSVMGLRCWMPAFATRMSKRPWRFAAPWMQAAPAAWSVTSNAAASPCSPLACSSFTRPSSAAGSRALRITRAPAAASDWAMAQPSPREAPVTNATLPASENIASPRVRALTAFLTAEAQRRGAAQRDTTSILAETPRTEKRHQTFLCEPLRLRASAVRLYGSRTVEPVVLRPSRSRCACAASFSA